MRKEYRLVESIGNYMEKRYEVQEKYTYYNNGRITEAWHMVMHSTNKRYCLEALEKFKSNPKKDYSIPVEIALDLWK